MKKIYLIFIGLIVFTATIFPGSTKPTKAQTGTGGGLTCGQDAFSFLVTPVSGMVLTGDKVPLMGMATPSGVVTKMEFHIGAVAQPLIANNF